MTERIEVVVVNPKAAEESQQAILISSLLVGGFISYWIYDALINWPRYSAPYKYALAFYFYTLIKPFHSFIDVWDWLQRLQITPFVNINFILSVIGIVIYLILFISFIMWAFSLLKRIKINARATLTIFILPFVLSVIWFVIHGIFSWLFMKV